jgi:hypothetical protein
LSQASGGGRTFRAIRIPVRFESPSALKVFNNEAGGRHVAYSRRATTRLYLNKDKMSDDEDPITLDDAINMFPGARLTKSTLRAERDRGNLDIFRLGKRDYTTRKSMRDMVHQCRENARRRVSTSTQTGINGSSETAEALSAQAALNQTVTALRAGLPRISAKSTSRSGGRTH